MQMLLNNISFQEQMCLISYLGKTRVKADLIHFDKKKHLYIKDECLSISRKQEHCSNDINTRF